MASFFRIGSDTEEVGVSERERVSCEVVWVHMGTGESVLDDSTVINIKCDCMVRCILISEVHLVELCRRILKGSIQHWRIPIVIGIPQDQIDEHLEESMVTRAW